MRAMRMNRRPSTLLAVMAVVAAAILPASARAEQTPTAVNLEGRRAFQDARFGMFIHWGVYSVLGDGEWVMQNRRFQAAHYERLPTLFNPTEFDAAEWVEVAKAAG